MDKLIEKSMMSLFSTIIKVGIREDKMDIVKVSPKLNGILNSSQAYSINLKRLVDVTVTRECKESVCETFSTKNIQSVYKAGEKNIDFEFNYTNSDKIVQVSIKIVIESEDSFVIFALEIVNVRKKYLKESENLINKLGIIYDEIGIINIEDWKMIKSKFNISESNISENKGSDAEKLLEYYINNVIHPDDRPKIKRRFSKENLIAETSVAPFTMYEEIRKLVDGQYQNYILAASSITLNMSESILVTCRNINELRQQKRKMDSYQRVINNTYEVILYVNTAYDSYDVVHTITPFREELKTFTELRKYLVNKYGDYNNDQYHEIESLEEVKNRLMQTDLISYELESQNLYEKNYYEVTFSKIDNLADGNVAFLYLVKDVNERRLCELKKETEHRMMFEAIKNAYIVLFSVNLTQNTYSKIQCGEMNEVISTDYSNYDQFIRATVETIDDYYQESFVNTFGRKALINAFENGKEIISMKHLQMYNDGTYHWNHSKTSIYRNPENNDILAITMVSEINQEIMIEQERADLEYCIKKLYGHILVCNIDKDVGKIYSAREELNASIRLSDPKFSQQIFSMVHPDDLHIVKEMLDFESIKKKSQGAGERVYSSEEVRVIRPDGRYYWHEIDVLKYTDDIINENKLMFAVKNVDEVKEAKLKRREAENRFSKIISGVYDVISDSNYTTDQQVNYFSENGTLVVKDSNYSVSKHIRECEEKYLHPDYISVFDNAFSFETVMNMDLTHEVSNHLIYKKIIDDSNEYKWCFVWYNYKMNEKGERTVTVCMQDIDTEQKKRISNLNLIKEQKEGLVNREITLKLLNERSRDVYLTYDKNTRLIKYCSPNVERVMGRTFKENSSIYELYSMVSEEDAATIAQELKKWNRYETFISKVFSHVYDNGEQIWCRFHIYPTIHRDENLYVAVLVDCTKDKLRQDELENALRAARDANNAKSQFLLNMSHDMRTPLNAVIGLTEIVLQECKNKDYHMIEGQLNKVKSSSKQLKDLISDVLNMAKIESGHNEICNSDFDVKQFGSGIDNIMTHQANENGIKLVINYYNIFCDYLYSDKMKLEHIAINIIGNAVKFTRPGGNVTVNIYEYKTEDNDKVGIKLECIDEGIGMSEEYMKRLYTPFERENTSTVSKVEGTGLGLAITKKLVDLLGGNIHIESKKGQGTKVSLNMILCRGKQQTQENQECSNVEFDNITVLVVEDKEINMEIACQLLKFMGINTERAWNGREALDMVESAKPWTYNLILMDCLMPIMDGIEATKRIRALDSEWARHIPIVAMTANAFEDDVRSVLEAGMNEHMAKPVSREQFNEVITKYLTK